MYLLALAQLLNDLWIEEDGWEESEIGIGKRERQVRTESRQADIERLSPSSFWAIKSHVLKNPTIYI